MTVSRRKNKAVAKSNDQAAAESGVQYHCDVCGLDISSTVRISCATCAGNPGPLDTYDLCCSCFLEGAENGNHKAWHDYRVVEQHAYPIFCENWGADEELLLIDGAQIYGLGNWADIADHIGNRTKEEVEKHYVEVYIDGRDGTRAGDERADEAVRRHFAKAERLPGPPEEIHAKLKRTLPVVGPNIDFRANFEAEEFQKRKRRRIDDLREQQAAYSAFSSSQNGNKPVPPKPLVSAPTSHSEVAGFMPGRLEFETEYEQDAENFVKDMEFGKVYKYGGETIPSELEALGGKAEKGKSRMEASGRGGPSLSSRGAKGIQSKERDEEEGGREKDDGEDGEEGTAEDTDEKQEKEEEADGDTEMQDQSQPQVDSQQDSQVAASTSTSTNQAPAETDDRAPDWDEDEGDLDLKLMVLEVYNERIVRRLRRKEFIFERNLIDYKRNIAAERKRSKEERELLNRVRHFAQMQTAVDFEEFVNGLFYEDALRRAASQLQSYRRAGITNLTDAARFEAEQGERAKKAAIAAEGGLAAFPASGAAPRGASRATRDTSTPSRDDAESSAAKAKKDPNKAARKPPRPLDLSEHPSLHLLTRAEQELCSVVRIQPDVFLIMKKEIIAEYIRRRGKFTRRESRVLFKCDVNKTGKVYDLLEEQGYLAAAGKLGWDGVGVPPGWKERSAPLKPASGEYNSNGVDKEQKSSTISGATSQSSGKLTSGFHSPKVAASRTASVDSAAARNSHTNGISNGSNVPRSAMNDSSAAPPSPSSHDSPLRGRPTAFT